MYRTKQKEAISIHVAKTKRQRRQTGRQKTNNNKLITKVKNTTRNLK